MSKPKKRVNDAVKDLNSFCFCKKNLSNQKLASENHLGKKRLDLLGSNFKFSLQNVNIWRYIFLCNRVFVFHCVHIYLYVF